MKKIRVGVFGAGRGMTMVGQLLRREDAELVAVCDKYGPALENCRAEAEKCGVSGIAFYNNFEDFLAHGMDAMVLANYANEHVPFAIRALDRGLHVMTECLTCASLKEAVELIEAVERSGKIYAYAENYCYTPVRWEMRERFRRGEIGELMYAEGEYVHDCSSIWPQITYGERNHWRNRKSPNFYCTHSIGPILYMTGLRPVKVVGLQGPGRPYMRNLGVSSGCFGLEMITLENGAILKSLHGGFKHTSKPSVYQLNGDRGGLNDLGGGQLAVYLEGEGENCRGKHETVTPSHIIEQAESTGHGGGDYYTTHYFIRAIAGDEVALSRIIDVYMAVDMCIPGILACRSALLGGVTLDIPNLRNKVERDACRTDDFTGDVEIDADTGIPDSVYEEVRRRFLAGEPG